MPPLSLWQQPIMHATFRLHEMEVKGKKWVVIGKSEWTFTRLLFLFLLF